MTNNKYESKPTALLINYGTVRAAELKSIYEFIEEQGDVLVSAVEKRFARPKGGELETSHTKNCLKFLRSVEILGMTAQNVLSMMNADVYPELSFEATLLHQLREQTGKQYHLSYIFDVLAQDDRRRITERNLLAAIKEDDSASFGLTWNTTKLKMWANLSDQLGAISFVSGAGENEIVQSPTRALLYELLSYHADHHDDSDSFLEAMNWINDEFLQVYAKRRGNPTLALGVADTLRNMDEAGVISLYGESDRGDVVSVPADRGDMSIARFTVDESSKQASFAYPLERYSEEVVA